MLPDIDEKPSPDEPKSFPSDLPEVVPNCYPESYAYIRPRNEPGEIPGKCLAYDQTQKEVKLEDIVSPLSKKDTFSKPLPSTPGGSEKDEENVLPQKPTATICGLPRRLFWLILIMGSVVVMAAVGGGVGGALAAASRSQHDTSAQKVTTDSTPVPSTTLPSTSSSTTSTSSAAASETGNLNNRTETFSFQAYENTNYEGNKTQVYNIVGNYTLGFAGNSYVWKQDLESACCATFCSNGQWGGWRCTTIYRPASNGSFDSVIIGCGNESLDNSKKRGCF